MSGVKNNLPRHGGTGGNSLPGVSAQEPGKVHPGKEEKTIVSEFASILHELVLDNPVPAKDLAKSIGKPYSTLLREVNPYDTGAKLGAETLLQIMTQTGDLKPLEFMASSLGYELAPRKGEKPAKSAKAL